MEEDRAYIRSLIIEARQKTLDLFDDIIKEFDRLDGPTVNRKKYASRARLKYYRKNMGVIVCKFRSMSKFIEKSLLSFKFYVTIRGYRADRTLARLKLAKSELDVDCSRGGHKKWKRN